MPLCGSLDNDLICLTQEGLSQRRQINLEQEELQLTLPYLNSLLLLSLGGLKTQELLSTTSHSPGFVGKFNTSSEENMGRSIQVGDVFFVTVGGG